VDLAGTAAAQARSPSANHRGCNRCAHEIAHQYLYEDPGEHVWPHLPMLTSSHVKPLAKNKTFCKHARFAWYGLLAEKSRDPPRRYCIMHLFVDLVYADLTSSTASYVVPLAFLYCDDDEFSKFYLAALWCS